MPSPLLTRNSYRLPARPALPVLDGMSLPLARAHELCGNARRFLAALVAARCQGSVVWISSAWSAERLNAEAASRLFDPGRILFVEPSRDEDILWCMEEALRSGAAPLVVADIPAPPALTPVRRLHLAAEAGAAVSDTWPLGLLLTPGFGGAQGIETRWHIAAQHGPGNACAWRLDRLRARAEPPQSWRMVPCQGGQFRLTDTDGEAPASPGRRHGSGPSLPNLESTLQRNQKDEFAIPLSKTG